MYVCMHACMYVCMYVCIWYTSIYYTIIFRVILYQADYGETTIWGSSCRVARSLNHSSHKPRALPSLFIMLG